MSGFRNLAFLERSLPFLAFVPFRRLGIMSSIESEDEMTHLSYSVFRTGGYNNAPLGDDRYGTDFGNVGGYSFSTRLTHLLYYDDVAVDEHLWHVGFSYDYSQLGANDMPLEAEPLATREVVRCRFTRHALRLNSGLSVTPT